MDLIIILLVILAVLLVALFVLRLVRPTNREPRVKHNKPPKFRRNYEEEEDEEEDMDGSAYPLPTLTLEDEEEEEEENNGTYVFDDVVFDEQSEEVHEEVHEEIHEEEPEVRVDDETTVIPLVPVPKFQTAKSLVQIVNLNPRHVIEIIGKQAVVYPHIVFDMATSERVEEEIRGWKVTAGQKLAITLGIKLLGSGVTANFVPAQTDYLEFDQSVISLVDFVTNKAIITIQARVLEDSYILKDFGIGRIKLV